MTDLRSGIAVGSRPDPFRVLGSGWVVSGGLVAAVTGPMHWEHGSWVAAFAVLVAGVAQYAFGAAQSALAPQRSSRGAVVAELVSWNAGSAVVIGGTIVRMPFVVDTGGLLLVVALVLLIRTVSVTGVGPAWALWTYRTLLTVILISIPIGLTLAHLRAE